MLTMNDAHSFGCLCLCHLVDSLPLRFLRSASIFFLFVVSILLSLNDIKATCRKALLHFSFSFSFILMINDESILSANVFIRVLFKCWICDTQLCTEQIFFHSDFQMKRRKDDERGRRSPSFGFRCKGRQKRRTRIATNEWKTNKNDLM